MKTINKQLYGADILKEDEELQGILKKLLEKNKETTLLTHIGSFHKYLTVENLIQELFLLKRRKNEDEAMIKMLKVQIRKLEKPEMKKEKTPKKFLQKDEKLFF